MNNDSNTSWPTTDVDTTVHAVDTQETVQSLELAIAQINMSLQESEGSINNLIGKISAMVVSVQHIGDQLEAKPILSAATTDAIRAECRQVQTAMQQAVTAFQFYDRLSQRFQHIQENLRAVTNVIQAPDQQHPALWQDLHDKVRSVYSLEQEQYMYKALMNGLSVEGGHSVTGLAAAPGGSDIEFF